MTYNESVQKLRDLHINTPEVICAFPQAETKERAEQIDAILKATADRLRCNVVVRTVAMGKNGVHSIAPERLREFLDLFTTFGSFITIFKAPKSKYELRGFCVPSAYYNTFTSVSDFVHQDYKAVTIWGHPLDDYPFPVGIRKPIRLANECLVNQRMVLDGMELEFTYHLEPEGSMNEHVVFWGAKQ